MNRSTAGAAALALAVIMTACDDPAAADPEHVYEVDVAGERFRLALETDAQVEFAEEMLETGRENNISGTLKRGNGGFNTGYSWHLDPRSVTFPDLTMEVCDGRPRSEVESDTAYWFGSVKVYCPWGAKVVSRVR